MAKLNTTMLNTAIRRLLIPMCLLGLLGRVVVPAGFMIAPLSNGWPVQPCPAQGSLFQLAQADAPPAGHHTGHHSGHEDESSADHEDNRCPLGLIASLAADLDQAHWTSLLHVLGNPPTASDSPASTQDLGATRARGPPSVSYLDA